MAGSFHSAQAMHLLEAVQVLEPGEPRIEAERRVAQPHDDAVVRIVARLRRRRHDDARHGRVGRRTVAARPGSARDHELDRRRRRGRSARARTRSRSGPGPAPACRAGGRPPRAAPCAARSGARGRSVAAIVSNKAVAVLQAAVVHRDGRGLDAVHQSPSDHALLPSARSRPRALARVSSNSDSGRESATMPAPVRNSTRPVAHRERADQDVEVERAVAPEVAHRARVRVARRALELAEQLHAAHLRAAGDRAAREHRGDGLAGRDARRAARRARSTRCGARWRSSRWS